MSLQRWESLGYLINHVARLFADELGRSIRPHGVTIGQFPLLLALWEGEGVSQAELSRRLHIEAATTTNTLRRMERDGLVERHPDPDDQRTTRVHLTERGRALEAPLTNAARSVNRRATQELSEDEVSELHQLLGRLIGSLESGREHEDRSPRRTR